eukprot:Rmarinus@m.5881
MDVLLCPTVLCLCRRGVLCVRCVGPSEREPAASRPCPPDGGSNARLVLLANLHVLLGTRVYCVRRHQHRGNSRSRRRHRHYSCSCVRALRARFGGCVGVVYDQRLECGVGVVQATP